METPRLILVTGVPGAGKTTICREVAGRLMRGAHIEADAIGDLVVGGQVLPGAEPEAEAADQLLLRTRNVAALAENLLLAGFTVLIDDVVTNADRLDDYLEALWVAPDTVIVLAPDLSTALQRDRRRQDKTVAEHWAHLDAEMREQLVDIGDWIDTTDLSVVETVHDVMRRADLSPAGPQTGA